MSFLLGIFAGIIVAIVATRGLQAYRQRRAVMPPLTSLTQQIEDHRETIAVDETNTRDATGKKLIH